MSTPRAINHPAALFNYVQVCRQQQKLRFFVCCEKSQVWRFLAVLCHVNNHSSPERDVDLKREIVSVAILCVTFDFSQFFVMRRKDLFFSVCLYLFCLFGSITHWAISMKENIFSIQKQKIDFDNSNNGQTKPSSDFFRSRRVLF